MNAAMTRAGWTEPGRPSGCIGSGQLVAFSPAAPAVGAFSAAWDTCPECGRRVQIVARSDRDVLVDHEPPAAAVSSRRDVPDGPSFGL